MKVERAEIMERAVTDIDPFTALRYLRHREEVPRLPEIEEEGQAALPGTAGALADLYHALWSPEPVVKGEGEVRPDRRYWRGLLEEAVKTTAYEELHGQTALKEFQSVLGTIAMGESVITMVPKEDRRKLQEQAEQSQKASELSQQAAEAQAEADAAEQLAQAAAAGQGQGQPQSQGGAPTGVTSGGGGMTAEAKARANALAKEAAQAKAKAENLHKQAQEAGAKAERLAESLLGKPGSEEAEQKIRELSRIGLQAVRDAQSKMEEISETIEGWGLEAGELHRKGIPEAMGILERMKRNPHLKKFAALLGRIRKIAARKARQKIAGEGARVTAPETGRDLKRAVPSELAQLAHPALRAKALVRFARGELRLRGQRTRAKLGHGPVVVCEDASGSMDGAKQQWAKAVTLALAHYAKLQKRSFGWVLFDHGVRQSKTYPLGAIAPEQMLELAESRAGGGTDFEYPLRRAVEMIRMEGLKKADICFVTDGECAISDEFLREFRAAKKALEFSVITVLCDAGSSADTTVREFSDRVEKVSAFTAEEAEHKVFRHF
jgi:uncharacterized protein with von Willebrand factor type A (vWA) domain